MGCAECREKEEIEAERQREAEARNAQSSRQRPMGYMSVSQPKSPRQVRAQSPSHLQPGSGGSAVYCAPPGSGSPCEARGGNERRPQEQLSREMEQLLRDVRHLEQQNSDLHSHIAAAELERRAAEEKKNAAEVEAGVAVLACQRLQEELERATEQQHGIPHPGAMGPGAPGVAGSTLTELMNERQRKEAELRVQSERLRSLETEVLLARELSRDHESAAQRDAAELRRTNEKIYLENRHLVLKIKQFHEQLGLQPWQTAALDDPNCSPRMLREGLGTSSAASSVVGEPLAEPGLGDSFSGSMASLSRSMQGQQYQPAPEPSQSSLSRSFHQQPAPQPTIPRSRGSFEERGRGR